MKKDYELLKKYLQNEIDTGGHKTFVFDKDYNVIEFKNANALSYLENMEEQIDQLTNNWNELEEWLYENESFDDYCNETTFTAILDKMKEIKERSNEINK